MNTKRSPCALFLLTTTLVAGCSEDFAPYSTLSDLRVMAVRSDPAWPGPGVQADLSALVHTPSGEQPTYAWSWCPLPLNAFNNFECDVTDEALSALLPNSSLPPLVLGATPTIGFEHTIDPDDLQTLCESPEAAGLLQGSSGGASSCGTSLTAAIKLVVSAGGDEVVTTKGLRLRVTADEPDNDNPAIVSFAAQIRGSEGAVPVTLPEDTLAQLRADGEIDLLVGATADSAETYNARDPFGEPESRRERLVVAWFVTVGEVEAPRTGVARDGDISQPFVNQWSPEGASVAEVFAVLRDGRGGVDWQARRAQLLTP